MNSSVQWKYQLAESPEQEEQEIPQMEFVREAKVWTAHDFAREQVRGLVRRVFLGNKLRSCRQVAFSAVEPETDILTLCDLVGRSLALETNADVAIIGREDPGMERMWPHPVTRRPGSVKSWSTHTAINLWHVPGSARRECTGESATGCSWIAFLAELRNEFEYAVIQAPAAGVSSDAALLGQLSDGVVLILAAHRSRKATARTIKETMEAAHCRILGAVLSERKFPVPEFVYRRL